ncbi:MAG: hypothetical protein AAB355_03570 [Patescibacteria group bacterium]
MEREKFSTFLLRAGVAFSFVFPPINAFFDPDSWLGYFPKFMMGIVPDTALLHGFGVLEIIIAVWIISGRKIFIPSAMATLMLIAIVIFNQGNFQVLFRDISISLMSLSLALMNRPLGGSAKKPII